MSDVLRALAISAGLLIPVVALIIVICIAVVRRGEAGHAVAGHEIPDSLLVKETAAAAVAKPAKAAVSDEISVSQILLLGTGLFVLTIILLLAVSLIAHLG